VQARGERNELSNVGERNERAGRAVVLEDGSDTASRRDVVGCTETKKMSCYVYVLG